MRAGFILSASLHVSILGWALFSLSGPPPLITMQDGGVEVDFASISPDASSANGEKKAEVDAKPVPVPTTRPEKAADAKNVGDANEDSKSRKGEVTDKPLDTEKTQAAPKAEKVVSAPKVAPEPVVEPVKKETPVETTEVASLNEPKVPVTAEPEPKEELPPVDPDQASDAPKVVPVPARPPADRPKPKPKTPETTERKKPEEPKQEKTATSTENSSEVTDKIGALLNKQENTAGGAKRVASAEPTVGDPTAKPGAELTRGEYDGLKGKVGQCWNIPTYVDQENLRIDLTMRMSPDGYLDDIVSIDVSGVENPAHASAVKSSLRRNLDRANCDFSDVLPKDKYETWRDVRVRFAASEL
jgi:hypothetical protein